MAANSTKPRISLKTKSCNTTDFESAFQSEDAISAIKHRLIDRADNRALDALKAANDIFCRSGKSHHAWLHCCLAVTYASAQAMEQDDAERKRFYDDDFFSKGNKLKTDKLLVHAMHFMVGRQKGGLKMASRYATALRKYFKKHADVSEVEDHLKTYGVEKLYLEALMEKYDKPGALHAADDEVAAANSDNDNDDDDEGDDLSADTGQRTLKRGEEPAVDNMTSVDDEKADAGVKGVAKNRKASQDDDVVKDPNAGYEKVEFLLRKKDFDEAMSCDPNGRGRLTYVRISDGPRGRKRFVCEKHGLVA